MRLPTAWPSTLPRWPPLLASRGAGSQSVGHRHHAMHLVLSLDGPLRVRHMPEGAWRKGFGVLTGPDVPHALDARSASVLLVFVDPESQVGAALRSTLNGPLRVITRATRDALEPNTPPLAIMGPEGPAWLAKAVTQLGGAAVARSRLVHPKVRRALRVLEGLTPDDDDSLQRVAREVGLSPGRFMHVFTESLGIAYRPYLAWLRLQRAAAAVSQGQSLTRAAAEAGFSDSAHLSRGFRQTFGMTATDLRAALERSQPRLGDFSQSIQGSRAPVR